MIVYDFECQTCGEVFEVYVDEALPDGTTTDCIHCDGDARKIFSVPKVHLGNQDATWLKSVREVVDKDPGKQHCQAFLKDPTRSNYKAWMKGEGLRPMDAGERPIRRAKDPDPAEMAQKVMKYRQQNDAITVST